jgi:cell division protein FtsZ
MREGPQKRRRDTPKKAVRDARGETGSPPPHPDTRGMDRRMGLENLLDASNQGLEEFKFRKPRILVVGCGGAGCNSVNRLSQIGIKDAEMTVINTDKVHLDRVQVENKFLLGGGITRGYGTGGNIEVAERAAQLQDKELRVFVGGADLTFITVGLGGGTGTGIAPIVARLAKDSGSIVVALATTPFKVEKGRQKVAMAGLEKLRQATDSLIILDNNRLVEIVPQLPVEQAFAVMDQLISEVVKNVTEMINLPGMINLDFADVRAVFQGGGMSTVLYGENSIQDSDKVVAETLNNPLLDVDCSAARGVLIHISSGPRLKLGTAYSVIDGLTRDLSEEAMVKFGIRFDPENEGTIKVMCIMTGLQLPVALRPSEGIVKVRGASGDAAPAPTNASGFLRR